MTIYRSTMEKILDKQEDETVITNPKEPTRTFFRKLSYIKEVWQDRFKRLFGRGHKK